MNGIAMMLKSMGIDPEEITNSVKAILGLATSIDTRLTAIENRLTVIEEQTGIRPVLVIEPEQEDKRHAG